MRTIIPAAIFLLSSAHTTLLQAQTNTQKVRPNIIYIYADDLGYGELGCYGQQKIKTPNLDRMAKEGIRFTQHYSGAPVCAPSRCMLLTGRNAGSAYIRGNYELGGFKDEEEGGQMPLPEGTFTIAKLMKQAGYATGLVGKWGLGMSTGSGDPNKHGFDYFYGYLDQKQAHNFYPTHLWENGRWDSLRNPYINVHQPIPPQSPDSLFERYKGKDYAVDKMSEHAIAFIRERKNKPFFLYLSYTLPHVSLQVPDKALNAYTGQFEEQPYYGNRGYTPNKYPLSTYAAMITYLDQQVGIILQLIKDLGMDQNTLIMFSSDNGATFDAGGVNTAFFNSVGGLRGRKQDLYEGGIRIPFLARWPGKVPAGKTTGHVSAQYDLMATLSELSGIKAPTNDGISFLPTLLQQPSQQQHPYLYFEFPEQSGQVAVRLGRWKGVKLNMKKDRQAPWELYDLEKDVNETTDVAAQHPELVKQMEEILQQAHKPAHIREWEFVDPKFPAKK